LDVSREGISDFLHNDVQRARFDKHTEYNVDLICEVYIIFISKTVTKMKIHEELNTASNIR